MTYIGARVVEFSFVIGDTVHIDKSTLFGVVTRMTVETGGIDYEVAWLHEGSSRKDWFPAWRLNKKDRT